MKLLIKTLCFLLPVLIIFLSFKADKPEYYELRIYHVANQDQEKKVENYLKGALLPALHRLKIQNVGVFKAADINDTVSNKRIFLLIPYKNLEQFSRVSGQLENDKEYLSVGMEYIEALHNEPAYKRIESTLLRAFSNMPVMKKPALNGNISERFYELRSYESPTEKLYKNKVHMFNEGGEIRIFNRLGFNPVFFGEVLTGSTMPTSCI